MPSQSRTRARKENSATIPVAVRLRPEDEDRLAELQARLGGVSRGEVVRLALKHYLDLYNIGGVLRPIEGVEPLKDITGCDV